MSDKLNDDGLVPGQRVDMATVAKVNRERSLKRAMEAREAAKASTPKKTAKKAK